MTAEARSDLQDLVSRAWPTSAGERRWRFALHARRNVDHYASCPGHL